MLAHASKKSIAQQAKGKEASLSFPAFENQPMALQKKSNCACGGGCPSCTNLPIQKKLAIGKVNDPAEQEADQIADQVINGSLQMSAQESDRKVSLQRFASVSSYANNNAPSIVNDVLNTSGQPLDSGTRQMMEPSFGHDLSHVRVHHDAHAAESSRAVDALAYTVGNHIVFDKGQYNPQTQSGKKLLAHELTHVMQQTGSGRSTMQPYVARTAANNCTQAVTGIADPDSVIEQARANAERYLHHAIPFVRAAINTPESWNGFIAMSSLNRHFHCPSREQLEYVLETLQLVEILLISGPAIRCLPRDEATCTQRGAAHFSRSVNQSDVLLCTTYFGDPAAVQAGTLITAVALMLGRNRNCTRHEACYNDFIVTAADMIRNGYSYGYFAPEMSGESLVPEPPNVPCGEPAWGVPATTRTDEITTEPSEPACSALSRGQLTGRQVVFPSRGRPHLLVGGSVDGDIFEERRDAQGNFVCRNGQIVRQTPDSW